MTLSLSSSSQFHQAILRRFASRSALPLQQHRLWQIEIGVVRTLTWLKDGTTVTLGLWGPGDVVGSVLSTVEPYQIECLTKVEAVVLPFSEAPQVTEVLLTHVRQLEELMVIRSHKKVDVMLINLLSWLAQKFGREVETGHLIDLRLTHQDIAELLGATRVTVTRTLSLLEQQGLICRLPLHRIVLQEEDIWHYEI